MPGEGNIVFADGETSKTITLPMPKRLGYFDDDSIFFKIFLEEPSGGAGLTLSETDVILNNNLGKGKNSITGCDMELLTASLLVVSRHASVS